MSFSVTNSLSIRLFYGNNNRLISGTTRKEESNGTLSLADASALRNGIRRLPDFDFESASEEATQEKLQAFVDTYNNTLESGGKYSVNDTAIRNAVNKMKELSSEKKSDLEKLGISLDKKTGYMTLSESAAKNIKRTRYSEFFSKDNEYLNGIYNSARHMTNRIDVLL